MPFLTHDELQHAILRDRGDGVFAHVQRDQGIDQRLCMHAHQMAAVFRQLAASKSLSQCFLQACKLYRAVGAQAKAFKEVFNCPCTLARHDLDQIAGLPAVMGVRRTQPQQIHAGAAAAGVDQVALFKGPVVVAGRLPRGTGCASRQLAEVLLPLMQRIGVAAVDLHRAEQCLRAALAEPLLNACRKPAEVRVLAITQGQH